MADLVQFPGHVEAGRQRRQLAAYLRLIADGIEADTLETDPHAFLLVLTGREQHEVLAAGYAQDGDGFRGATWAVSGVAGASFPTAGKNIRRRGEGGPYGGTFRSDNVVLFASPRTRASSGEPAQVAALALASPDAGGSDPSRGEPS